MKREPKPQTKTKRLKYKPETPAEIASRADTLMRTAAVMQSEAMRLYAQAAQRRAES